MEDSHSPRAPGLCNSSIPWEAISTQKTLMSPVPTCLPSPICDYILCCLHSFFQLVVKATTLGFAPRVPLLLPKGAGPAKDKLLPESSSALPPPPLPPPAHLPVTCGSEFTSVWPSSRIWARAASISPSCVPPSAGLSGSPALGLWSVVLPKLPLLSFSVE